MNNLRQFAWCLLAMLSTEAILAQSPNAPINNDYYHLIERYEIKSGGLAPFFTTMKPYQRQPIALWADSLAKDASGKVNAFNLAYLQHDNWEYLPEFDASSRKPILKHFYRKQSAMYHVEEKNFSLTVNPVLLASLGTSSDREEQVFISSRGLELRGLIGGKVGFYTFLTDNQARFPQYVMGRPSLSKGTIPDVSKEGALPQAGFWKVNETEVADFFRARGHVSMNIIDQINIQMGHDKQFIGNGYRSMALSDFAPNYFFIRMNTKVWKLNYTNLYASIAPQVLTDGTVFRDKYFALHHLSLNVSKKLNIGIFENIVFSRGDTINGGNFDVHYLNPIIFLRAVEHNRASLDNAMIGFDAKWNLLKGVQLYGQFVFDEFRAGAFFGSEPIDYVNKFAWQVGAKYIDAFGIDNLDLQAELNQVRPFMYTHNQSGQRTSVADANYQHYGQPLAHPLGANFRELVGILRYQPIPRLQLNITGLYAKLGEDREGENWGGDIFKDYSTATQLDGNVVAQGLKADLMYLDATLSYQLRHNLFIDLKQIVRDFDSQDDNRDLRTTYTSFAIRWNISQWRNEF